MEQVIVVAVLLVLATVCYRLLWKTLFFTPVTLAIGVLLWTGLQSQQIPVHPAVLTTIALLCYVAIVQFTAHNTQLFRLDTNQRRARRLSLTFLAIFVSSSSLLLITVLNVTPAAALFFACVLGATTMPRHKHTARAHEILLIEHKYTALFSLVIPFLIAPFLTTIPGVGTASSFAYAINLVTSLGVGIFVGVVFSKLLVKHKRQDTITSILILLLAGFFTYALSDQLGGIGGLSVATLGLFLLHAPKPDFVERGYERSLHHLLSAIAVLSVASFAVLPLTQQVLILSIAFLGLFYAARFLATLISLRHVINFQEKLHLTLTAPAGIDSLVALLFFHTLILPWGVTTPDIALLSQATLVLVFATNILALISAPFLRP